jgi:hypothetical protein
MGICCALAAVAATRTATSDNQAEHCRTAGGETTLRLRSVLVLQSGMVLGSIVPTATATAIRRCVATKNSEALPTVKLDPSASASLSGIAEFRRAGIRSARPLRFQAAVYRAIICFLLRTATKAAAAPAASMASVPGSGTAVMPGAAAPPAMTGAGTTGAKNALEVPTYKSEPS